VHLTPAQLTGPRPTRHGLVVRGILSIALLHLVASHALARPELVPLSPGVSIPASEVARLGHPAVNAGGTRIAYVHGYDPVGLNPTGRARLFAENLDGSGRVQITIGDMPIRPEAPVFTVDGQVIYFTAEIGDPLMRELFRAPSAGGPVEQLTDRSLIGGDAISHAIPTSGGGAWFAVGSDLLNEGLNLSGGRRVFYQVAANGQITRRSDPSFHPSRDAELLGISADNGLVAFVARDPNMGGQRTIRPFILTVATGQAAAVGPPVGAGEISGVFSPIGQRIVMSSDADYLGINGGRTPQIFRADVDAATFQQLTQATNTGAVHPGTDSGGNLITFESAAPLQIGEPTGTRRVYVQGSGTPTRRLSNGWEPAISVDGSRVVFVADHDSVGDNGDGSIEIFSATPSGLDLRQHSRYSGATGDDPHVSADGMRVVLSSTGNLDGNNGDGSREIWGCNADGTGLVRLSTTLAPEFCREPAISPDGQWVAFSSNADLVAGSNPDGNEEIFRIRFDGSELMQITDTSTGANHRPRMSTDGRRLVFLSTANLLSGANMGEGRVAFWREATGVFQLLTPPSDRAIDALYFSHDGTRIALLSNATMEGRNPTHAVRIFAAATDGTLLRSIGVPGGLQAQGLGFSGDGGWFAAADLAGQLLLLPWSGGDADTVMSLPGVTAGYPSVNLDGSRLSFVSIGTGSGFRLGDIYRLDRGAPPTTDGLLDHTQPLPPRPPVLSANGQTVAFLMTGADTLNPDGSREVFAARLPTTAVTWLELSATIDAGAVRLLWRVAADEDHAGFVVARASRSTGPWERINGSIDRVGDAYSFRDTEPAEWEPWYRIDAVDRYGRLTSSTPVQAPVPPGDLRLTAGPNPSRGTTWIEVTRRQPGPTRLDILSVTGRLVRRLADDMAGPGTHRYLWTGHDDAGNLVAPGIYFIRANGMAARAIVRLP